jgi:DNA-binding response OmpR family regulator
MPDETKKILAVDDDRTMLELYKASFQEAGYIVQTTEDTTGAIIKYHEFKPDLLVLDVDIPGGGGVKVYEKVRDILEKGTAVIFVTGYSEKVKFLEKNPRVLIMEKPLDIPLLLEAVNHFLSP